MDKENGKGGENCSTSSKLPSQPDSGTLLDAASLFGAYWPRGADAAANSANLFASAAAASGAYGLGPHPSLPFGMLPPPASGRGMASYPPVPSSTAAAAAYSNAYTNTLSVAASQAASLGIPAASAAWWSMASHLAAQDYLARFQASGLNFASLGSPSDLQYSALGLHSLSGHHKKNSKNSKVSGKDGKPSAATVKLDKVGNGRAVGKYGGNNGGVKSEQGASPVGEKKAKDLGFSKEKGKNSVVSGGKSASIFTSPLSLASNSMDRSSPTGGIISSTPVSSGILSDPNSVLGGVRLPPDTEIIKYTSSIIGPKVPGTTNRGRKKTISLDPPLVSVHPSHSSTGMLIERSNKRPKLNDPQELNLSPGVSSDKVEVIKLPATNGSPSGLSVSAFGNSNSSDTTDTPLNLSLKPSTSTVNHTSSSLNSLSNMSANIGVDRISRRKPGPKPRRVVTSSTSTQLPPGAPSASLVQLFASADSPRPPSRAETPDSHSSGQGQSSSVSSMLNHKDGRPRNLGRGVSKPKKNTVASLLAQSRALGIKPMPMLDPNVPMNQQMSVLKSNILAAQQYIAETGGDEKTLNKFLQEKFRSTLSDSSTVDASTDSDNLTDSNQTDSEFEMENVMKKQKQYDENALRVPLEKGWKRETVIRGLTKSGGIKGDVTYIAPESTNKFKQMSDVTQYLDHQKSKDLTKDNFTFSCRVILGDYLQPIPTEMGGESTETVRLTEEDINRRLEELRATMRTSLPVEQRIEVARRQQAARIAARLDREQARLAKEIERSEKQEAARRDREARSQQMMEARRKRQEEMEKHKLEEQQRKQQEREMKRQQAAILKEQIYMQEISKHREMFYTVELERERRRQHMSLVKALENRRKLEERERKKQQVLAEKQANKEKKLEQRRMEMEILSELRKPCEDLELQQKPLPEYSRIPGLKLSGQAFADILMVFEFLHNFGETLGFDMESLPTLESLQQALLPSEIMSEAEEELFSVMTHLIVCAIEDPGIPNPARHTTILGQSLRQADITHMNLSEILRIYLYANATGEVKALTGVHFERDREKRVADHHQNDGEMQHTQSGKNAQYYELLHENPTWKMSDMLKDKPFMALSPTDKAAILAFICNELLQNKAVIRQIEGSLETVAHCKKEKWLLDAKIRKLRILHNRKVRSEAVEKAQAKLDGESLETPVDSPSLNKDDLLDDEENEMSENESVGTQPEEEEDNKLSGEELGKKLEKILKMSEAQLHTLNASTHQLRATCYGQDRYWRRYWSLPKAGGVFVEAMESAQPEVLESELEADKEVKTVEDVEKMVEDAVEDPTVDQEVRNIIGEEEKEVVEETKDIIENGIEDKEKNLEELRKSVDRMVEDLGKTAVKEEYSSPLEKEDSNSKEHFDENCKKFSLFEKLGQCMERENKTDETEETKDDIKNEILNELKSPENKTIKQEPEPPKEDQPEQKWFSVVPKDSMSCDNVCLTAGNRWDCGVGICTRDNITELKIPVFPPPNNSIQHSCDSPAPLQMTSEECAQLEYIKKHGMPKNLERRNVPHDKRYGWWRITDPDQLKAVLENLHVRGARERELKRTFLSSMQSMYEMKGKFYIEEGHKDVVELSGSGVEEVRFMDNGAPQPDVPGCWSRSIAHRVDLFLLEQVELLEDKVANASMQIKGWKIPNRDLPDDMEGQIVSLAKERLAALEAAIERRYLKPPLGVNQLMFNNANNNTSSASTTSATTTNSINTETPNNQNTSSQGDAPSANGAGACDKRASPVAPSPSSTTSASAAVAVPDDIPKGLATWREAVVRSQTSAQLAMCLYMLEASIAWDKSIMKANCQFCHSGDNEDKLLLCDGCDKGYHTYCFKPKMDNIPDGDWYCHECMNKATGERNCIVCGKKQSTTGTRLVTCDLCPRAYHTDCIRPPIGKVPRGKWYCTNCIAKKPQKKVKKNCTKPVSRDSESSDHPPPSPAPSHSSVTTSEDLNLTQQVSCNQSDVSNSSLTNACSPSAQKKERVPKKLLKELAPCKVILEDLECHDDAWPFLLPVNTKQFPTYKKIIKSPMDLSTIKKRLQDVYYKSRDEFCADVRQIFNNCETFNEDDSPVGKAGHCMRQFFESRWTELCSSHS